MTKPTDREQKLVDIMTQCAMMIHDPRGYFKDKDYNEVGDWIRSQLQGCGFPCMPMGMSHVYLTEKQHPEYK